MIQVQAVDLGIKVPKMNKPGNRLFCRLDGITPTARAQRRCMALNRLGLLKSEAVPVFEEATQTASNFTEAPICILGLAVEQELWFKSAFGLSTIGLMNQLASYRKISLEESFSTYVIDSEQPLVIENTISNGVFARSNLTQHYGVRAYLGVPLISSEGLCIGTLEVMDVESRQFSSKDIDFLALTARWCLREFERDYALKSQQKQNHPENQNKVALNVIQQPEWETGVEINGGGSNLSDGSSNNVDSTNLIKVKLLAQLTQELRTPLTSVIGMASVLRREVYGPLTTKQREYLEIIHNSGQNLISLVDEIVNLGVLGNQEAKIVASSVDLEMLCQQVINGLGDTAKQHQQNIRLSVEPGNRIWSLDKDKVKQALYYLIISVLEMSESGGEVRIHVSRRNRALNIAVWLSHPWLGDGLPQVEFYSQSVTKALAMADVQGEDSLSSGMSDVLLGNRVLTASALMEVINSEKKQHTNQDKISRDVLGLLFCCHLTELHQGKVIVQGASESGYRYILQLPKIDSEGHND
ncbi:signal transduction histidine kinase [Xenococcus sp. PCC 7305]|uniref:GAF domain-containing sensor histidine kinase n=1 Tax=Xenococcus sp. PCC 7305 TaxID=102125 RepID=UPI0002ACFFE3|nr:GAF domain-containing sensor histidine kinase [Xenococcus sp. PCC 7305]ELS00572.1 signal transduction histidine kinase [Xenococcus sp. PCC 7305]